MAIKKHFVNEQISKLSTLPKVPHGQLKNKTQEGAEAQTPLPTNSSNIQYPANILQLQRTLGNRAVGSLLESHNNNHHRNENPRNTELPSGLKIGMESLSGVPLNDVKVVYNSPQPEKINALAYTQGSDIHIAPGQEQHLPHEAWHVVQQKQGRVPPTKLLKGQALINDDNTLEQEANVMGSKAAQIKNTQQSQVNQNLTAVNQDSDSYFPGTERSGATKAVASKTHFSPVIQRTIWRYNKDKWEVFEKGTEGEHKTPKDGKDGEYFNDLTGKRSITLERVRGGLVDLMAVTGSIEEFKSISSGWSALAKGLEAVAGNRDLIEIGQIKLYNEKKPDYLKPTGSVVGAVCEDEDLNRDSMDFVLKFLRENKQLAYIERRPWYKSGEYHVEVDINFYNQRPMGAYGLGMHKDTGGDNLFVNIIFNNEKVTPATEWTQDREEASKAKLAVMKERLPEGMLNAITSSKKKLKSGKAKASGFNTIEGGTLPKHGYVSWVDELLWHSTPSLANRPTYTKTDADTLLQTMKEVDYWSSYLHTKKLRIWTGDGKKYEAYTDGKNVMWHNNLEEKKNYLNDNLYEVMVLLAEKPGTLLNQHWQQHGGTSKFEKKIFLKLYDKYFKSGKEYHARLVDDIKAYAWEGEKKTGLTANELDTDLRVHNIGQTFVPTGIRGRTRKNSNADMLQQVQAAAKDVPKRSFIRTWVRIVKS